jgi:serine/threonine protein kinase
MAKSFGPWEIIEPIDEGGMGHVFLVKHKETGQRGTLKRLKNPERLKRFKQEVEAVRLLNHPGIAGVIDSNLNELPYYAVFEYEEGG